MSNLIAQSKSKRLLPGAIVMVRPWSEILATLDSNGMLDGLPFMAEMVKFCGRRFRVSKAPDTTCEETQGNMRRIRYVVFLEGLRCDGLAHGGCQKGCFIFWKEAWLQHVGDQATSALGLGLGVDGTFPFPSSLADGQYICQSAELIRATSK